MFVLNHHSLSVCITQALHLSCCLSSAEAPYATTQQQKKKCRDACRRLEKHYTFGSYSSFLVLKTAAKLPQNASNYPKHILDIQANIQSKGMYPANPPKNNQKHTLSQQ